MIKFNINVRVKLTSHGHHQWALHNAALGIKAHPLPVDAEGYTEFQLWDLMHVFGSAIRMGGLLMFETEILLEGGAEGGGL